MNQGDVLVLQTLHIAHNVGLRVIAGMGQTELDVTFGLL